MNVRVTSEVQSIMFVKATLRINDVKPMEYQIVFMGVRVLFIVIL